MCIRDSLGGVGPWDWPLVSAGSRLHVVTYQCRLLPVGPAEFCVRGGHFGVFGCATLRRPGVKVRSALREVTVQVDCRKVINKNSKSAKINFHPATVQVDCHQNDTVSVDRRKRYPKRYHTITTQTHLQLKLSCLLLSPPLFLRHLFYFRPPVLRG